MTPNSLDFLNSNEIRRYDQLAYARMYELQKLYAFFNG